MLSALHARTRRLLQQRPRRKTETRPSAPTPAAMADPEPVVQEDAPRADDAAPAPAFRLLDLPPELIAQVLGEVGPADLARVACASRALRGRARDDDVLWQRHCAALELPAAAARHGHAPFGSWRELYAAHAPFWFLARQRLWVGDRLTGRQEMIGQVVVARYDARMGALEALRLRATNGGASTFLQWAHDPTVIIHLFAARVEVLADDPVVRLEPGSYPPGSRLAHEIPLVGGAERSAMNRRSRLMLARALPERAQGPATAVWPPRIVPAAARVRVDSPSLFRDPVYRPHALDQVCQTAFRTRTWCEFMGLNVLPLNGWRGAAMGEEVTTFSSLPPACYTPTPDKPYQGIWVGDYSGHGAEFLLLTQKSPAEAAAAEPIRDMADDGRARRLFLGADRPRATERAAAAQAARDRAPPPGPDPPGCSGRLEAIKLTGDPNVPCGQYTFVAEDLGSAGFVRVAREEPFVGARIVRSWGHVASRGFMEDGYIPCQLIMVSHNCLAQFWEEFGHISFFKRIDIDKFLDADGDDVCCPE